MRLRVGLGDADLHVEIDGPDVDALRVVGEDAWRGLGLGLGLELGLGLG